LVSLRDKGFTSPLAAEVEGKTVESDVGLDISFITV